MRTMAVILALALAGCTSEADEVAVAEDRQLAQDLCREMSALAETTMGARQEGVRMADLMDRTRDGEVGDYSRALITEAYRRPRFQSDEHQQRSIVDFANEVYHACISD